MIPDTIATTPLMVVAPLPPVDWPTIPGYQILEELGRGGMGVVYKARQAALNRFVAIKMILTDSDVDDRIRFLGEAESVAAIEHPNVVRIHAFGQADDRPYLVMEYVGGGSLAYLLREFQRLPARSAAGLVSRVARGVQAVHEAGIVHRDLKPANILLQVESRNVESRNVEDQEVSGSDVPTLRRGDFSTSVPNPKVSDFGIAKRSHSLDMTQPGVAMGTPAYMAPEQASGKARLLGPPSDVHALGAILFECLTGRVPFEGDTPEMVMYRVVHHDAPRVRQFAPAVPRELELICEKCLAKKPEDRYASAAALADDLDRFLAGEPVSVVAPGRLERAARWVRKRPALAAAYALGALALVLAAFTAVAVALWFEADAQRVRAEAALAEVRAAQERADEERRNAEGARFDAEFIAAVRATDLAYREYEAGNLARARQHLDSCPPRFRSWEWHLVNQLVARQERPQAGLTLPRRLAQLFGPPSEIVLAGEGEAPSRVAVSSDGRHFATATDHTVRVWDSRTASVLATVRVPVEPASLSFGAAAASVTVAGRDGSVREWAWRADRLQVAAVRHAPSHLTRIAARHPGTTAVTECPDGSRVATGSADGSVRLWDATTGTESRRLAGHTAPVKGVAFSPDGTRLVSVCSGGCLRVWDGRTGLELLTLRVPTGAAAVCWSADGTKLAVAGANLARILDASPTEN